MHVDVGRPRKRRGVAAGATPFSRTARTGRHAGRHAAGPAPAGLTTRLFTIAVLAVLAALLLVFQYQVRHLEAAATAAIYGVITPTLAAPGAPIVWFGLGTPGGFGLVITPDCSSALLIEPLCVLGMGLAIPRRLALRRVCLGLTAAAALLVTGNMARIGLIAGMVHLYGIGTGYQLGHLVLGSLVSIAGIAASMAALTLIVAGRGRGWARRSVRIGRREIAV